MFLIEVRDGEDNLKGYASRGGYGWLTSDPEYAQRFANEVLAREWGEDHPDVCRLALAAGLNLRPALEPELVPL
jgi:hypothetical protein